MIYKIKTFMWLAQHNRLPTSYTQSKMGISSNPNCPIFCDHSFEDILHIFFKRPIVQDSGLLFSWSKVKDLSLVNLRSSSWSSTRAKLNNVTLIITSNGRVFSPSVSGVYGRTETTMFLIKKRGKLSFPQIYTKAVEFTLIASPRKHLTRTLDINIKWISLLEGTFKLKTDGSCLENLSKGGIEGEKGGSKKQSWWLGLEASSKGFPELPTII